MLHRRTTRYPTGALAVACIALVGSGSFESAGAAWPPDGAVICTGCLARSPIITSDGAGGAYVAWTDARNSPSGSNDDVFVQRVTASGEVAPGWPAGGLAACLAPGIQGPEGISPDGFGGVIVAWRDYRSFVLGGETSGDIYAQRILSNGTLAPGWPVNGVAVTQAASDQMLPVVLADGHGGAFVTWDDEYSSLADIFLQHLGADGTVMPGWPSGGLLVCAAPGIQGVPELAPDGAGGVLIVWGDLRDGSIAQYAQRVMVSGELFPGWPPNGISIVANRYMRDLVADGAGGAYLACATAGPGDDGHYFLQRFDGSGEIVLGWPAGGAPVCLAAEDRAGLRMEPDGAGGVLMAWSDYREPFDSDVYAVRMRPDGTRDPRWPLNGLPVTVNATADDVVDLTADGQGGAYLTWDQTYANQVMIQHLTDAGTVAPGWPAGGRVIPTVVGSPVPRITADGAGGAIVAWEDTEGRVRALRLAPDGPVPVAVSLVSAEAEPGLVRLTWFGAGTAALLATVERRALTSEWESLAEIVLDGTGRLTYEDRSVAPGLRYGYRLAYRDGDELAHTEESWVTVPALRFALRGLTPNPSAGDPVVSFSLASHAPATLELFDLHGRLVLSHEAGAPGPGAHSIRLEGRGRLSAGVYSVRLRQGPSVATARAIIVR